MQTPPSRYTFTDNAGNPLVYQEIDPNLKELRETRSILMFLRSNNIGKLIVWLGSGLGESYGLPKWSKLIDLCVDRASDNHELKKALTNKKQRPDAKPEPYLTKSMHRLAVCEAIYQDNPKDFLNLQQELARKFLPARVYKKPVKGPIQSVSARDRMKSTRSTPDPLYAIHTQLNIHRYITTNYDLEIETLLEDLDFPYGSLTGENNTSKNLVEAHSRLGARASSITIRPGNSARLIATAALPNTEEYAIVHVHGSAHVPESLVVFPDQYNALYIDKHREWRAFEDGRNMLFGGNAIIYIATGLEEEDVLRPLRYLRDRSPFAPIYAFIAARHSEEEAVGLVHYVKKQYGINVIIYGRSFKNIPETWKSLEILHPLQNAKGADFIALYEELANIADLHKSVEQQVSKFSTSFPRLSTIYGGVAELKAEKDPVVLERKCTDLALEHLLGFINSATTRWSHQLKAAACDAPTFIVPRTYHIPKHTTTQNTLFEVTIKDSKSRIQTAHLFPLLYSHAGVTLLLIRKGKGKGTVLASVAQRDQNSTMLSLNATWRAEIMLAAIERSQAIVIDHAAQLLCEQSYRPRSIYAHQALKRLIERRHPTVLVVKSDRELATLHALLGNATRMVNVDLMSDPLWEEESKIVKNYSTLRLQLSACRWLNGVLHGMLETIKDKIRKETFLGLVEDKLALLVPRISESTRPTETGSILLDSYQQFYTHSTDNSFRRVEIVLLHIALKWMYVLASPISLATLARAEELLRAIDVHYACIRGNMVGERATPPGSVNGYVKVLEKVVNTAVSLHLIYQIEEKADQPGRYLLHSHTRKILAYRRGVSFEEFHTGDWSSVTMVPLLSSVGVTITHEDYEKSLAFCDNLLGCRPLPTGQRAPWFSGAFSLIRCRFSLGRVLHMGQLFPLEDQEPNLGGNAVPESILARHLRRLCILIPRGNLPKKHRRVIDRRNNFCLEDRIWLFSEMGACSWLMGQAHDAALSFRLALEAVETRYTAANPISRDIEWGAIAARLKINLALVMLDRGNMHQALEYLRDTERFLIKLDKEASLAPPNETMRSVESEQLIASVYCGRALANFALGLTNEALADALALAEDSGASLELRAYCKAVAASILADARQLDRTEVTIGEFEILALDSRRPDLQIAGRLLRCEIDVIRTEVCSPSGQGEILHRLDQLELEAKGIGLERLRLGILLVRARALITWNQLELAAESVTVATCISLSHGLRVKRLCCVALQVALMACRGEGSGSRELLIELRQATLRMRFARLASELTELESSLDDTNRIRAWARSCLPLRSWL